MNCPTCKETQLILSERKGIEIDYCPSCRGIWLDRGELDKIIERTNEATEPVREKIIEPTYRKDQHYDRQPYKRKKSFFEELFD